ncbi:MAG: nuclear transport factor 2 family protein [Hyphomicrobium sp.]|nr:nuclear transport factor 2 family protein [Hyphomicrobium sp.]
MSIHHERAAVHRALERWAAGDLEGALAQFSEDILYIVNVDGLAVPFVASSLGKEDLRQRLQLIKATFYEDKFEPESVIHEADYSRAIVNVENRHRATGERLCVRLRLRYWVEDGLIVRAEEHLDAQYIEAFQRFVFHMENAAARSV